MLDVHWSERFVTGISGRRDREVRTRAPFAPVSAVTTAKQRLRLGLADAYAVYTFAGGDVLEAGVFRGEFANRIRAEAATEAFAHGMLTDVVYALWTHTRSDWLQWLFSLQVGAVRREVFDGAQPPSPKDRTETTEMKAGVGIILREAGSYRVLFNSTWDLDVFDQRQWDGGNVQLQWLF